MFNDPQESKAFFELVLKITLSALAILALVYFVLGLSRRRTAHNQVKYRWTLPEKLVYFGFVLTVVILGITSFVSVLVFQGMHGWWLLAHMTGAGGFAVCLAIMSWTLSFRFMFDGTQATQVDEPGQHRRGFPVSVKLLYWMALLLSVPVVGAILLSMFPLFGTQELIKLVDLHRYSSLALFSAVALHFLLVAAPRH